MEDVAKAGTAPQMFQLYAHGDHGWMGELLARVEASGYKAVALTVDVQKYSRRERDVFNRFSPREAMEIAPNPRGPLPDFQSGLTWDDVEWLMKTTKLPVGLKGIMTVADARRAVDMGVRLIWVSNHGGRQLDQTQSTIEALPPIADAVAGRAEIMVDGGFNRGTDVIKALARGARVVACGRTMLWGLAADGADGVARVCEIMRDELHHQHGAVRSHEPQGSDTRSDLPGGLSPLPLLAVGDRRCSPLIRATTPGGGSGDGRRMDATAGPGPGDDRGGGVHAGSA